MSRDERINKVLLGKRLAKRLAGRVDYLAQLVRHRAKISERIATVKEQMTSGEGFAGPLVRTRLFPPMLTQMVRVGEETGTLDTYLEQAAEFYEEDLEYRIRAMTSLIEPVMTVAVGVIVGFIAVSLISAMYGLVGALK